MAAVALVGSAVPSLHSLEAQPRGGSGFLFQRPRVTLAIRAGATQPSATGDVFQFVSRQLTVDRDDYRAVAVATDLSFALSNRIELVAGVASSARRIESEYRDFVDNNDLPIEQQTTLRRTPLTLGVRLNLLPSGRSVSRLAWVPSSVVPYVVAGLGTAHYRFAQDGDFVDFKTNDVFKASLSSSGWTTASFAAAGLSWALSPSVGVNTELRFDQGSAALSRDFEGFRRLSLNGTAVTAGFTFRY